MTLLFFALQDQRWKGTDWQCSVEAEPSRYKERRVRSLVDDCRCGDDGQRCVWGRSEELARKGIKLGQTYSQEWENLNIQCDVCTGSQGEGIHFSTVSNPIGCMFSFKGLTSKEHGMAWSLCVIFAVKRDFICTTVTSFYLYFDVYYTKWTDLNVEYLRLFQWGQWNQLCWRDLPTWSSSRTRTGISRQRLPENQNQRSNGKHSLAPLMKKIILFFSDNDDAVMTMLIMTTVTSFLF